MRRLDNIDLRLLRVFVALVEAGGFSGAQIVLNLSQSTLSTHLAEMEQRIGGQLCVRGRKAFRLTDLGQATYDAALKLFADIEDFRYRVAAVNGRLTGRLRLGIVDGVVTSRQLGLQHAMARMLQSDFDVMIDLSQATPLELEQAVAEGGRDVVIGPFSQQAPGVVYKPVYREPNCLYCGRDHPLFAVSDGTISRAQIEAARLSVRGYRHLDDLYRIGHPKAAASVLQMEAQAMLVLSGHFIGFLPSHLAEPWVADGQMRAVQRDKYAFYSQHYVAFRSAEAERPIIRAFIAALEDHLRSVSEA
ncbi:LysR family transcriptional regulator [Labrys monachus]|uniref:DNA-binding transcriptional LysR family regulator n=1 Tax=Labrys monachus TaxID=217067 RepID=A0ABU0FDW5_9HYPH|nr:LysR family transcriptional regulator [Labrys monachus]MDQ0392785.1 DNA-binding transcriptional LysR family regulator [Labrys monachus]